MAIRITNEPKTIEHVEVTGIFKAAESGDLEAVKNFLSNGCTVNDRDSDLNLLTKFQ